MTLLNLLWIDNVLETGSLSLIHILTYINIYLFPQFDICVTVMSIFIPLLILMIGYMVRLITFIFIDLEIVAGVLVTILEMRILKLSTCITILFFLLFLSYVYLDLYLELVICMLLIWINDYLFFYEKRWLFWINTWQILDVSLDNKR